MSDITASRPVLPLPTAMDGIGLPQDVRDDVISRAASIAPDVAPADALEQLLGSFRILQLHHARVLHHESNVRGLNATDIRFVFFLSATADEGVTPKQGGEYLELSTGAMTSLVDRLERQGHIVRRPNPDDRRSVLIHLTPSGRDIALDIGAVYRDAFRATVPAEYLLPLALAFDRMGMALEQRRLSA